jgi:hypothetical protein
MYVATACWVGGSASLGLVSPTSTTLPSEVSGEATEGNVADTPLAPYPPAALRHADESSSRSAASGPRSTPSGALAEVDHDRAEELSVTPATSGAGTSARRQRREERIRRQAP